MATLEKVEIAELLGRLHSLPEKQKERVWFVIDGLRLLNKSEGEEEQCLYRN